MTPVNEEKVMPDKIICALCGSLACAFVKVKDSRKDYKYREVYRCKECLTKALRTYGEEGLVVEKF